MSGSRQRASRLTPRRLAWVVALALAGALGAYFSRPHHPDRPRSAPSKSRRAAPQRPQPLTFDVREGAIHDVFYQRGPIAAHLLATSGTDPRLLVAFPAGNGGAAVWFAPTSAPVHFDVEGALEGVSGRDGMRGITATLRADGKELQVDRAVLGSIRVIRSVQHGAPIEPQLAPKVGLGPPLRWTHTSLDRVHHYALELEPLDGATAEMHGRAITFRGAHGAGPIRLRVRATSDEPPLTPLAPDALLTPAARHGDRVLRHALRFLGYREKVLAGSWRFLTYFGRDTLLSVRLLMPVLEPEAIEDALGSVLERLDPTGRVAHEEDIGEQAARDHLARHDGAEDLTAPTYDYKMIDEDFLLAPILAHYLLDTDDGRRRGPAFLARHRSDGRTYADAVRTNLDRVLARARPYAAAPGPATLIALRAGQTVGDWRDSQEGLGGRRVPYDVNVALVPAALRAAARLYASPLLGADGARAAEAKGLAKAWRHVGARFRVEVPAADAKTRVRSYAREVGVPAGPAVDALDGPVVFAALALGTDGTPLPVMSSDTGFLLLFDEPPPETLERIAAHIVRPFPAGLRTPIGMMVANPVFVDDAKLRATFGRDRYHGTVVWSWQQALMAEGIARQLARHDLPPRTRSALVAAQGALWAMIDAGRSAQVSELWSWAYDRNATQWRIVPFVQVSNEGTESDAVQLWSTVYLAVHRPEAPPATR